MKLLRLALLALRQRTFSLAVALEDRKHSKNRKHDPDRILSDYLELLLTIVNRSYDVTESLGFYYSTLAELVSSGTLLETDPGPITETVSSGSWEEGPRKQILQALICVPLRPKGTRSTDKAYESFSTQFLTYPNLPRFLDFDHIARGLSLERLNGAVLSSSDEDTAPAFISRLSKDRRLAFLAYYIHIFRVHADIMPQGSLSQNAVQTLNEAYGRLQALRARGEPTSLEASFLRIVTLTLSDAVSELDSGLDFVSAATNPWMREYILGQTNTLIDREFMTQLLETTSRELPGLVNVKPTQNLAALMANYILVLLQLFPQRKNDIRLWIYAKWFVNVDAAGTKRATSALRFFWDAFSYTGVFHRILETPKAAVEMMRDGRNLQEQPERYSQDQAWRVGFLFLELYSFALRIMDDEEFTRGFASFANVDGSNMLSASSLTLKQVQDLSRFLKNLAYAVYWHSSDILKNGDIDPENRSFADYFGRAPRPQRRVEEPLPTAKGDVVVAGIRWANFGYVKGMVTGVLKALYERDSRRPFLPKDHWLMPQFDMAGFIPVVVEEQQYRMEHDEDTEMDEDALDADEDTTHDVNYVGNSRTMQQIRAERMRKRMERASRKKTLENVTPRLEILQNMPFFIPFATRVQIFREFVAMDQRRRRGGVTDPDQWRMRMADSHNLFVAPGGPRAPTYDLSRHAARVRREYIFEDAYQQFFALGDGLKEPIQITFVDRFGAPEPGIDGGGVTKEFLTSVTAEAFTTSPDPVDTLFVENDEHLLYPNPGFFDGLRDQMRREGEREGGPEWNTVLREAAARYEFLGRVVGKCLYEGILVDIHFAPFFLVKWALTGGSGFAANESSYLASVNDLRDLDKDLYQGLVSRPVICASAIRSLTLHVVEAQALHWQCGRRLRPRLHRDRRVLDDGRGRAARQEDDRAAAARGRRGDAGDQREPGAVRVRGGAAPSGDAAAGGDARLPARPGRAGAAVVAGHVQRGRAADAAGRRRRRDRRRGPARQHAVQWRVCGRRRWPGAPHRAHVLARAARHGRRGAPPGPQVRHVDAARAPARLRRAEPALHHPGFGERPEPPAQHQHVRQPAQAAHLHQRGRAPREAGVRGQLWRGLRPELGVRLPSVGGEGRNWCENQVILAKIQ